MGATTWREIEVLVAELERQQLGKVVALARRLRPDLTQDDIANPHDFPELCDADWQYADGVLAGIKTVLAAVRARRRESEDRG